MTKSQSHQSISEDLPSEKADIICSLQEQVQTQKAVIDSQSHTIQELLEALKLARHRQFGSKSEKSTDDDLQGRLFDEAALDQPQTEIEAEEESISVPAHDRKKKSAGRKPLPENLPRIRKEYDLPESEKSCTCGCELTCIGEVLSEQLDYIPAKVQVIQHARKKYACKSCEESIKIAVKPKQPIEKSIASAGLLSYVCVSKFEDYLPLYRQARMFERIGIDLPRSSLSNWVIRCGELLLPLYKLLQDRLSEYDIASADETTLQVLKEPDKPPQSKSYMWTFSGGPPKERVFIYHYAPSRSADVVRTVLDGFEGYLHCDGYRGYDSFAHDRESIKLVGCWYHVRRKFVEVAKLSKKPGVAAAVVQVFKNLSKIESKAKKLTPLGVKLLREKEAKPLLTDLKKYLTAKYSVVPPKSSLGLAISYTLNQWDKLMNYLEDGRLAFSNNHMERAVKPFVMGRKNWLFANSQKGADAAAIIYSLIETCKAHQIQPYDYLKHVFGKLPTAETLEELEALLPFHLDQSQFQSQK